MSSETEHINIDDINNSDNNDDKYIDDIQTVSKSINGYCYWFGYNIISNKPNDNNMKNEKKYLLRRNFIISKNHNSNNLCNSFIGQFISSSWFKDIFDIHNDIKLYIIKCDKDYDFENVKRLFMKNDINNVNNLNKTQKYNEYSFIVTKSYLQDVYNELLCEVNYLSNNKPINNEITTMTNSKTIEIKSVCDNYPKMKLVLQARLYYNYEYSVENVKDCIILSTPSFSMNV